MVSASTSRERTAAARRQFLVRAGLMGAGTAIAGGLGAAAMADPATASDGPSGCPLHGPSGGPAALVGDLRADVPDLPPFASGHAGATRRAAGDRRTGRDARRQGRPFGPDGGPVKLITDPSTSLVNRNNPLDTAGVTFVGQFIDHDLTFDATSKLGVRTDPTTSPNGRTPRFDLDSVYGAGPVIQTELYDPANPIKLRLETGGHFEDVPRRADGSAIMADLRNDSNLIISRPARGVPEVPQQRGRHGRALPAPSRSTPFSRPAGRRPGTTSGSCVNQFLPELRRAVTLDAVLHGSRRFYRRSGRPFMPVEFSGAAYRFGHSMVRPSYRANLAGDNGAPFFGLIFDPRVAVPTGRPDRPIRATCAAASGPRGGSSAGRPSSTSVAPTRTACGRTSSSTPSCRRRCSRCRPAPSPTSPATPARSPCRSARCCGTSPGRCPPASASPGAWAPPVLHRGDLADLAGFGVGLDTSTPLWLYVLREAMLVNGGGFLGPVGGRIVAEVLLGLLQADPTSYLSAQPDWQPTLGAGPGTYTMANFLTFAGVDPTSRGQ